MPDSPGRLHNAARDYAIASADWVDLSAAANAQPYPVHPIDPACWQSGCDDEGALEAVAGEYYGNGNVVALPGEQAAIDIVPALFGPLTIACIIPADAAELAAWERAGHKLRRLPTLARALAAATPNILLATPSAISAATLERQALLEAAAALQRRGGFLIVDERYADADPASSLAALAGGAEAPNVIVLRSLDAFFGLAGARVAFVLAAADKIERLRQLIVRYPLAQPSRAVARQALADHAWQTAARRRLDTDSQRLAQLIAPLGAVTRSALFCVVKAPAGHVAGLFEHFARRAILTRRFDENGCVRFSVPRDEGAWQRLAAALAEWTPPHA